LDHCVIGLLDRQLLDLFVRLGHVSARLLERLWAVELRGRVRLNPFDAALHWACAVQQLRQLHAQRLGALATHHILDEELVDCPPASSFRLPGDLHYLIGHNIDFDWQAVGQPEVKRICTLALARKVWPEADSHSQSALLYFLERDTARERLREAHSAAADIGICATILSHLCAKLNITTMEALCAASDDARLPTHMTFGKHKGLPLAEVPKDYVRWLLDQQNVDPYVRQAFMALNAKKS
jgi:exodeoxyribonuclease X